MFIVLGIYNFAIYYIVCRGEGVNVKAVIHYGQNLFKVTLLSWFHFQNRMNILMAWSETNRETSVIILFLITVILQITTLVSYVEQRLLSCKILSGQLSWFAALPDLKFQKRPNFFFKTAKIVERFCKVCQNNPFGNSHNYESAATSWKHDCSACLRKYYWRLL